MGKRERDGGMSGGKEERKGDKLSDGNKLVPEESKARTRERIIFPAR